MKSKQIKEYLGKVVTFRDVWDNFETAKLIEVNMYVVTFEREDGSKIYVKGFNIAQIQAENNLQY